MKSHKAIAILSALALGLVGLAPPAAASSMQLNETAEDSSPLQFRLMGAMRELLLLRILISVRRSLPAWTIMVLSPIT